MKVCVCVCFFVFVERVVDRGPTLAIFLLLVLTPTTTTHLSKATVHQAKTRSNHPYSARITTPLSAQLIGLLRPFPPLFLRCIIPLLSLSIRKTPNSLNNSETWKVLKFQHEQDKVSASNEFFRGLSKEADLILDGDVIMVRVTTKRGPRRCFLPTALSLTSAVGWGFVEIYRARLFPSIGNSECCFKAYMSSRSLLR